MMAAVENDVETQQKGCVLVFYLSSPLTWAFPTHSDREKSRRILIVFPLRVSAFHICLPDNPAFSLLKAAVMASIAPEARTRMRFHSGE
jgi:hypothetical protein